MTNNIDITKDNARNFIQLLEQTESAEANKKFKELSDDYREGMINPKAYRTGTKELIKGNETLVQLFSRIFPSSSQPTDSSTTTSDGEDQEAATTSTATATVEDPEASRKNRKNRSKKAVEKHGLQQKEDKTATSITRVWEITDDEEKDNACQMFVQRVKDRAENHQIFQGYVNLVNDFKNHRDVDRVNNQVCELFKNQPELHIEFSSFLVDAFELEENQKEQEMEELHNKKREREQDLEVPVKKKQKRPIMPEIAETGSEELADKTESEKKEFADVNSDRKELDSEKMDASTELVIAAPVCIILNKNDN